MSRSNPNGPGQLKDDAKLDALVELIRTGGTKQLKDSGKRQSFPSGMARDIRQGKGRYDLIPPGALRRVALLLERGAVKYGDNNWRKGQPFCRALDSADRHLHQYIDRIDDEDHLAQTVCNLLMVLQYEEDIERGWLPPELDDRYQGRGYP